MGYYDKLIEKWPTLTSTTTEDKLAEINALMMVVPSQPCVLSPSQILNAIVFADLAALAQLQVSQLSLLLSGSSVDASPGTSIRLGIQALFAGKTQTLQNLGALVAPFDDPPDKPWWSVSWEEGGGGLSHEVTEKDLIAAGDLS